MPHFTSRYLIGSIAKASINRNSAKALVRLAPPQLVMKEIPFRNFPSAATTAMPTFKKSRGISRARSPRSMSSFARRLNAIAPFPAV